MSWATSIALSQSGWSADQPKPVSNAYTRDEKSLADQVLAGNVDVTC
jgi:hypothetical protein